MPFDSWRDQLRREPEKLPHGRQQERQHVARDEPFAGGQEEADVRDEGRNDDCQNGRNAVGRDVLVLNEAGSQLSGSFL